MKILTVLVLLFSAIPLAHSETQYSKRCESVVMVAAPSSSSNEQDTLPIPREQLKDLLKELNNIQNGIESGTVTMQGRVFKRHPYCVKCVTGREAGR